MPRAAERQRLNQLITVAKQMADKVDASNGKLDIRDPGGTLWNELSAATTALETELDKTAAPPAEHVRLVARLRHGQGTYMQANERSKEAIEFFVAEEAWLRPLIDCPPESIGGSPRRGRPWPVDAKNMCVAMVSQAEARE
jgi:hypothetical protein